MSTDHFKVVSSFLGGSVTLYGCTLCGTVVWDKEVHIDIFHCGPEDE